MSKKKAVVDLAEFLMVVLVDREKFSSVEETASALGMTPASFKQRLGVERKRYPNLFKEFIPFSSDKRRIPTEEEAIAIFNSINDGLNKCILEKENN